MRSLHQQVLILMLGALVLLSGSLIIGMGLQLQKREIAAAVVKAQSDLAMSTEVVNQWYPGSWRVQDGVLYKGNTRISNNSVLVDRISKLNGDTVTMFLGDTRVTTTLRESNGHRAIGTKVSDIVAQKVLKDGEQFLGQAPVLGHIYQTAYEPIRDATGNIIGIFYVGISETYDREMIQDSVLRLAGLGIVLTLIVGILAWLFTQRVIIKPLREITFGARDVATGHITEKVDVNGPKEIGELAVAFNQMVERLESIAGQMETAQSKALPETAGRQYMELMQPLEKHKSQLEQDTKGKLLKTAENVLDPELPKGLNQATLRQILLYLDTAFFPISAEDVAEGVKLTRVTVKRYLEYLEQCEVLVSELKYGAVGRPVKLFSVRD